MTPVPVGSLRVKAFFQQIWGEPTSTWISFGVLWWKWGSMSHWNRRNHNERSSLSTSPNHLKRSQQPKFAVPQVAGYCGQSQRIEWSGVSSKLVLLGSFFSVGIVETIKMLKLFRKRHDYCTYIYIYIWYYLNLLWISCFHIICDFCYTIFTTRII